MTRDEAVARIRGVLPPDWVITREHLALLDILEALGLIKFDEPMPDPRRRAWEASALSRAIDEAYIAAATEMRAGAITDALRMRGFKIVRA